MIGLAFLRTIPAPVWVALLGAVVVVLAMTVGYQVAVSERQDAVQKAKDRADEITEDVDRATDDDLIDGLLKSD